MSPLAAKSCHEADGGALPVFTEVAMKAEPRCSTASSTS
jgi:hypothetical protein